MQPNESVLTYAPIALFVYNRLDHARQTIDALKENIMAQNSDLIVFSDAAKSDAHAAAVREVRSYVSEIEGFKSVTIVERDKNFGLARSIIDGVTSIVNARGNVIVLEDDLVTSPYFLQFMNDALRQYEKEERVISVHGYVFPVEDLPETFFIRGADCWGWATWKDRWALFEADGATLLAQLKRRCLTKQFDLNGAYPFTKMLSDQISGKNDSWAIRWHALAFLSNKLTLYPGKSLVLNIGNDGSGVHCGVTDGFSSEISMAPPVKVLPIALEEDRRANHKIERYLKAQKNGVFSRLKQVMTFFSKK